MCIHSWGGWAEGLNWQAHKDPCAVGEGVALQGSALIKEGEMHSRQAGTINPLYDSLAPQGWKRRWPTSMSTGRILAGAMTRTEEKEARKVAPNIQATSSPNLQPKQPMTLGNYCFQPKSDAKRSSSSSLCNYSCPPLLLLAVTGMNSCGSRRNHS